MISHSARPYFRLRFTSPAHIAIYCRFVSVSVCTLLFVRVVAFCIFLHPYVSVRVSSERTRKVLLPRGSLTSPHTNATSVPPSGTQILLFALRNDDSSGPASKLGNLRGLTLDDSAASFNLQNRAVAISRAMTKGRERTGGRGREGTPTDFIFVALPSLPRILGNVEKGAAYALANIFRRPPRSSGKNDIFVPMRHEGAYADFFCNE